MTGSRGRCSDLSRTADEPLAGTASTAEQVQAAEIALRRELGLVRVGDLRLVSVDGARVRFRDGRGEEHEATVEETAGQVLPASCGAQPEAQRMLTAQRV